MEYLFWTVTCFLIIGWYIIVTVIVTFKGGNDIKKMLKELSEKQRSNTD